MGDDEECRERPEEPKEPNLADDYGNFSLLLLLYYIQGVPMGLASSVPLMLQEHSISYSEQAMFELTGWPFCLKLLWAPIVDSVFIRRFGRRKTWMVPVQLLLGFVMVLMSFGVGTWLPPAAPFKLSTTDRGTNGDFDLTVMPRGGASMWDWGEVSLRMTTTTRDVLRPVPPGYRVGLKRRSDAVDCLDESKHNFATTVCHFKAGAIEPKIPATLPLVVSHTGAGVAGMTTKIEVVVTNKGSKIGAGEVKEVILLDMERLEEKPLPGGDVGSGRLPMVVPLTAGFFMLYFFSATQDIALDGWAISMLKPHNVGYQGTANIVGQTVGYLSSYVLLMAFSSPDISNYFRAVPKAEGLLDLSSFLLVLGIFIMAVTSLVAIFKTEGETEEEVTISEAYLYMFRMAKNRQVQILLVCLAFKSLPYCVADFLLPLKLIGAGFPASTAALQGTVLSPIVLALMMLANNAISGPRPLRLWTISGWARICLSLTQFSCLLLLPYAISRESKGGLLPWYLAYTSVFGLAYQLVNTLQFGCMMSFFSRISDPALGGTYMTALAAASNFGGRWPGMLVLWLADYTDMHWSRETWRPIFGYQSAGEGEDPSVKLVDGVYPMFAVSLVLGVVASYFLQRQLAGLEGTLEDTTTWHVGKADEDEEEAKKIV